MDDRALPESNGSSGPPSGLPGRSDAFRCEQIGRFPVDQAIISQVPQCTTKRPSWLFSVDEEFLRELIEIKQCTSGLASVEPSKHGQLLDHLRCWLFSRGRDKGLNG